MPILAGTETHPEWIRTLSEHQAMTRAWKRWYLVFQPTEEELRELIEWASRQSPTACPAANGEFGER